MSRRENGTVLSGCLQVITRPAGRVRSFQNLTDQFGSGQEVFEASRVGTDRAGSGRIKTCSNLTGRVGSGSKF